MYLWGVQYLKLRPSSTLGEFAEAAAALCERSEYSQQAWIPPEAATSTTTSLRGQQQRNQQIEQNQQNERTPESQERQQQEQGNDSNSSGQSQQQRLEQNQVPPRAGFVRRHVELAKYCFAASYAVAFLHEGLGVSLHDTR